MSADANATPGSPGNAPVKKCALPNDVPPGATVDVAVALDLPATAGSYPLSYDVSCGGAWFSQALAVEYHDAIAVALPTPGAGDL